MTSVPPTQLKKTRPWDHEFNYLRYEEKFPAYHNERKSEQAHIPQAPTLLENAVYNEWQFHALGTGNRTKKGI